MANSDSNLIAVHNLCSDQIWHYDSRYCTPKEALINCYEQYMNNNWNTWQYDYTRYDTKICEGSRTLAIDNFCVLKEVPHA